MPECKSALQEDLKAYLDGELPGARRVAVERHLTDCTDCRSELEGLRLLSTTLVEALPATAPLPDALRARILASLPEAPRPRPFSLPFWRRPGPMAAFSGVLAMGCAAWFWVRTAKQDSPTEPATVGMSPVAAARRYTQEFEKLEHKETLGSEKAPRANIPATFMASSTPKGEARAAQKPTISAAAVLPAKPRAAMEPAAALPLDGPAAGLQDSSTKRKEESRNRATSSIHFPESTLAMGELAQEANKYDVDQRSARPSAKAMTRSALGTVASAPTAYTLTVPKGKKAETQEALRRLATELEGELSSESLELELRVSVSGREPLLERMKALGKLTETPPATSSRAASDQEATPRAVQKPGARTDAFGGGGGGFGGGGRAMRGSGPVFKLTVTIKEAETN